MTADEVRSLYEFHFTRNREIWDHCVTTLTVEQFKRKLNYSVGSIRNQCVHIPNVDERWFSGFHGDKLPGWAYTSRFKDFASVRKKWEAVETYMRKFLVTLTDEMLDQDFMSGVKKWQVLYHVLNHGTDHRAQILAGLDSLGAPTFAQDYFFYAAGMPIKVHPSKNTE
jgi:uncharacterized damage-inducible protein DinB